MIANHLRLPVAWRPSEMDSPDRTVRRIVVRFADLAAGLDRLGQDHGRFAVLLAAHVKVLSMLTEEHVFRTDVGYPVESRTVRRVDRGTWRQLVDRVAGSWPAPATDPDPDVSDRALIAPAGPGARAAGGDGLRVEAGDTGLAARVAGAGDGLRVEADDTGLAARVAGDGYGLRVEAGDTELCLELAATAVDDAGAWRLASMYRLVLAAMAADAAGDAVTARLPDDERRAVLDDWATGPPAPGPADTVVDRFRAQAARTPDAVAVTVAGTSLTYRDLDERSNQIAHHLASLGAGAERLVGVCLRRTADLLPALLGVWKAGAAYLPLDAALPAQRLRHMVTAAGCDLLVTTTEHRPALAGLDDRDLLCLDTAGEAVAARPRTAPDVRVGPATLAYVIYTSGSTGVPKGVLVHHGGLANYLAWTADAYASAGTGGSAFFTSIGFDLGIPSLLTPLLVGQRVDLLPDPIDPAQLGARLAGGAPYSFLKMTPGHLNLLSLDLDPAEAHGLAGVVIAAGDAFPVGLARRWVTLAGPGGTAVATEYGPTEITVGNSGERITDLDPGGLVPLGAPIPGTTMYVLTDELEPAPVGVPGEVYVGGAGVSRGYLGDPALTADRFRPDPYGRPGTRLYRTGDRARWDRSGRLEFLGRTDHQVKIRGYRVEPAEIQETLRRHPDVGEAVVIVGEREHRPPHLAAFVMAAPGRDLDPRRLRADLAADLPDHMVPAEIVAVSAFPLTTNGKVDTRALRGLL